MKLISLSPLLLLLIFFQSPTKAQATWEELNRESQPQKRHENAFVKVGDKFYLLGGRGLKEIDIYDPTEKTWKKGQMPPVEMSHFQAVSLHGLIYVMGGLRGSWPSETPLTHILIYDPIEDYWVIGPEIPKHRQRGAAGVTIYNNKIYLVCGIVNGHTSGWVSWFDEYDLATNTWRELPDAPRARDHFQATVVGEQLVVTGGRKSGFEGKGFEATIAQTDIYDFTTGKWITLPSPSGDIPTQRAGCTSVVIGDEVIVIGGESGSQEKAHSEVEALNVKTKTWRKLPNLKTGRHGTQVIPFEGSLYIASGCGNRGGSPELNSFERYTHAQSSQEKNEALAASELQVSTQTHDFGKVKPFFSEKATFQLSNKSGNKGTIITYMILPNQQDFEVDFPYELPYVLAPNETVNFEVTFHPKGTQAVTGELIIKTADKGKKQPITLGFVGNQ